MSKDYNNRFNTMLKYLNVTRKDLAKTAGFSYSAFRNHTRPSNFSRWAKLVVWVFEEMQREQVKCTDPFNAKAVILMKSKENFKASDVGGEPLNPFAIKPKHPYVKPKNEKE